MKKIMIVDGNTWDLQRLSEDLSRDNIVLICSRATKAMDLLRLFKPNVLILDPSTPGISAKNFIGQVRLLSPIERIPIFALTRMTSLRHIEESFEWGVDVIFSKPLPIDRLRGKLAQELEKTASIRQFEMAAF